MLENVCDRAIDLGISPPAPPVMERTRISDSSQHESMADAAHMMAVLRQPSNCPYGSREKTKRYE